MLTVNALIITKAAHHFHCNKNITLMSALVLLVLCNAAVDDMFDVSHALDEFYKAQWKVLGRELGLKSNLLEEIKANHHQQNGVGECFNQVLKAWLKRNHNEARFGPPTWHSLADAVERSGDLALAAKLRAKP